MTYTEIKKRNGNNYFYRVASIREGNKVNKKRVYVMLTRKLRAYLKYMQEQGKISSVQIEDIRNKIKNRFFKNKSHLVEYIRTLNSGRTQK